MSNTVIFTCKRGFFRKRKVLFRFHKKIRVHTCYLAQGQEGRGTLPRAPSWKGTPKAMMTPKSVLYKIAWENESCKNKVIYIVKHRFSRCTITTSYRGPPGNVLPRETSRWVWSNVPKSFSTIRKHQDRLLSLCQCIFMPTMWLLSCGRDLYILGVHSNQLQHTRHLHHMCFLEDFEALFLKVAPYSFDCTAHNCIQKTIILSSCKVWLRNSAT
jgi:hypothetical protein